MVLALISQQPDIVTVSSSNHVDNRLVQVISTPVTRRGCILTSQRRNAILLRKRCPVAVEGFEMSDEVRNLAFAAVQH